MTDKFQNKYRIQSARAAWWNYANNAAYFIAICTKRRAYYFGEIVVRDGHDVVETPCMASLQQQPRTAFLQPTEIGQIAESEWLKTPSIRPDMNLELDEFVLMPNHFHAIIWIGENEYNRDTDIDIVETRCIASLPPQPPQPPQTGVPGNKFGPQTKNLASILRGFKSAVTTFAVKNDIEFGWQERFHDHIIRDEDEYQRIKNYIVNNPSNWETDKFYN